MKWKLNSAAILILQITVAALTIPTAFGADTAPPPIVFPDLPAPIPQPKPSPSSPASLDADVLYVATSDLDLMVKSYPAGLLSVTKESGPIRIRGRFVDGSGKVETRTYKGKSVVIIEAIASGSATLVIVPVGAKTEAEWVEKSIEANVGPRPPPPPPVPPTPPVPPAPTTKPAWVVVVEEGSERTLATGRVLGDVAGWQSLSVPYRFYDKDDPAVRTKKYDVVVSKSGVAMPAMIFLDKSGNVIGVTKLPATMAEIKKMVNP